MNKAVPRVRNTVARRVAGDLERAGLSLPGLLKQAGIKPSQLADQDGWLNFESHALLLELAARELKQPGYGLRLASLVPPRDFGVLAYVGLASKNLEEALRNLERYLHVQSEAWLIEFSRTEQKAVLSFLPALPHFAQYAQATESGLSLLLNAYGHFLGQRLVPHEVGFIHAPASGASEKAVQEAFGCPVRFRRNRVQISLDAATLRLPIKTADSRLLTILKVHCVSLLKERTSSAGDIVEMVKASIAENLSKGGCTARVIGKELGLTERTLHRRLAGLNTSFRDIIDEFRKELSHKYLHEERLSLKQVAFLLGYSDVGSFRTAYRRWTGKLPVQARRA